MTAVTSAVTRDRDGCADRPDPGFDSASAAVSVLCASRDGAVTVLMQVGYPCFQRDRHKVHANAVAPQVPARLRSGCLDRS